MRGIIDSNLMPLAASIVVLVYGAGVLIRRSTSWYEWLAAALGVGFAVWFWAAELGRARRGRSGDDR